MLVTIKYNKPIGDFKAIERTERFYAMSYFEPAKTSLVYFKINEYSYKTVAKSEIVSIEQ